MKLLFFWQVFMWSCIVSKNTLFILRTFQFFGAKSLSNLWVPFHNAKICRVFFIPKTFFHEKFSKLPKTISLNEKILFHFFMFFYPILVLACLPFCSLPNLLSYKDSLLHLWAHFGSFWNLLVPLDFKVGLSKEYNWIFILAISTVRV